MNPLSISLKSLGFPLLELLVDYLMSVQTTLKHDCMLEALDLLSMSRFSMLDAIYISARGVRLFVWCRTAHLESVGIRRLTAYMTRKQPRIVSLTVAY
jgi:hypothetical protein